MVPGHEVDTETDVIEYALQVAAEAHEIEGDHRYPGG
jgi:hypothetical protein